MGAALAALAARHADDQGAAPKAIYVFGMPRAGGEKFRADYNAKLGPIADRLVHGLDVVASIPSSGSGFRHVGRLLQCDSGNKLSSAQFSDIDLDQPDLGVALVGGLKGLLSRNLLALPVPVRSDLSSSFSRSQFGIICRIAIGPRSGRSKRKLCFATEQFNLLMRLYWPKREVLDGTWTPPPVKHVD